MRRSFARFAVPSLLASLLFLSAPVCGAQTAAAVAHTARVAGPVDAGQTVRLSSHRPGWATAANDQGALDPNRQLINLHLILARAPEVEAAFQQLLADQQNPASPRYHQWLTPQQNAEQYGIAATDLAAVTGWLQSQGLRVDDVVAGGVFLTFSGPASAVQEAFSTSLHNYLNNGNVRYATTSEPAVPAAVAGVIQSVAGLSEEVRQVHSQHAPLRGGPVKWSEGKITPSADFNSGAYHFVAPGDFNAIYDITAAQGAGYTGTGYRVVILIDSAIVASDISAYEGLFGLPAVSPNSIVLPGTTSPGVNTNDEGEADLDSQRVIATAPGAGVDLLLIPSLSDANIFSGLQYEISTLNDAAVNMSFGGCNTSNSGATEASQYSAYYSTASAQGVSLFNSSGDSGAAGCDTANTTPPTTQVLAANILCMSPYITCVGGTEFADTASPSTYWSSTNSSTLTSALGYIPEGAWNEPLVPFTTTTQYEVSGSGGGPGYLAKPSYQTGTGVPNDGFRDTPDVAFTASAHNGYLICEADQGNTCSTGSFTFVISGTSASSPSMAGVATLLDQKLGGRQGNLNPLLYKLAASANSPFHDVTVASSGVTNCAVTTPSMCNNSTPAPNSLTGGLSGYLVTTGYDQVTGLGSLDVQNFLNTAVGASASSFTVVPVATALNLANTAGATVTDGISLTSVNGFAGAVALTCSVTNPSGTAAGTCSLSPASPSLAAGGTASSTLTVTNTTAADSGTLTVTVTGTSGTTVVSSTAITVTVSGPTFTITPASTMSTLTSSSGNSITDGLTVNSINGFAGTLALTCKVTTASGTAAGTCTVTSPLTLTAGGSGSSTLTVTSSAIGTAGALTVAITGTSGTVTANSTVTVTVTAPSFSISPSTSALSFTSGATTGNSTTLTVAPTGGFLGTVSLTCSLSVSTAAFQPTCVVAPGSVTVTANGSPTATVTISSTTAKTSAGERTFAGMGWGAGGVATLAMLLLCTPLRKRRRLASLALLTLLASGAEMLGGCAGGGGTPIPTTQSSAGSYTLTINGTGTTTGGSTASTAMASVSVTIN